MISRNRIAVLITYWNEGDMLRECLNSLAVASYPDEVLVYDDASADPAEAHLPPSCPARVIRGERNRGPSYGRNLLLKRTQCDYVHFHDADDWFASRWTSEIKALLQSRPDLVITEVASILEDQLVNSQVIGLDLLRRRKDLIRFALAVILLTPSTVFRRSVGLRVGGYRESLRRSEDFDFHVRLAAAAGSYEFTSEPLVKIRLREEGFSRSNWAGCWEDYIRSLELLADELSAEYRPDLAEAGTRAGSQLFQLGRVDAARKAFAFARRLGPASFLDRGAAYRWLAKGAGQEVAERFGSAYRRLLPQRFRRRVDSLGL